jgi:hypothetical protein
MEQEDKQQLQHRAVHLVKQLSELDYGPKTKGRPGKHEFYTHQTVECITRFTADVTQHRPNLMAKKYQPFIKLLQKKAIKDLGTAIYGKDFAEKRDTWDYNVKHNARLVIPR